MTDNTLTVLDLYMYVCLFGSSAAYFSYPSSHNYLAFRFGKSLREQINNTTITKKEYPTQCSRGIAAISSQQRDIF